MADPKYICADCKKEIRIKAVSLSAIHAGLCPQCYTMAISHDADTEMGLPPGEDFGCK